MKSPSKFKKNNHQSVQPNCSKTTDPSLRRIAIAFLFVVIYLGLHFKAFNSSEMSNGLYTFGAPQIFGHGRTLHMIQCIFGNGTDFIDEWEVSFKSIIFNAPLDSDLHVHIICDDDGASSIENRIREADLLGSRWRNKVSVTVTNLRLKVDNILEFLKSMILTEENRTGHETEWMDERVGVGSFLRLFAYKYVMEYIPKPKQLEQKKDLRMAFYLDVDVVIISNLNHLVSTVDDIWINIEKDILLNIEKQDKPRPLWVWGQGNAGFLGINLLDFDEFWGAVARCKPIRQDPYPRKNDQWLLGHVSECFNYVAAALPDPSPWSVHIGHGYRNGPHKLNRTAGMLHLQSHYGKKWFEESKFFDYVDKYYVDKFCHRAAPCFRWGGNKDEKLKVVRNTWGLADYYVRMSWDWAIYQSGESRLPHTDKGYNFTLVIRDATSNFKTKDLNK